MTGLELKHALKASLGPREITQVPEGVTQADQACLVVSIESKAALEGVPCLRDLNEVEMIITAFDGSGCVRRISLGCSGKRCKRSDTIIGLPEMPALLHQAPRSFGGGGS